MTIKSYVLSYICEYVISNLVNLQIHIMKLLKLFLVVAVASMLAVACKNDKVANATQEAPAITPGSTTQSATAAPPAAVPVGPTTTLSFVESEFDFGEIQEGEKITHEYHFTNTGKEPLVISKAVGSCGCTVPDWPREPIASGEKGVIKVQYDSRGKGKLASEGGKAENKRVTITANTEPANTYLTIKGKVIKPDAPAG